MPSDSCPHSASVAAVLADPAARLDTDLASHLPGCDACRRAAAAAVRDWPTDRSPSPSLAEWLSDPAGQETMISPFQAEALARGQAVALELGPYLLLDRLGAGGMGEVYRAWHKLLRREDAVKTVRPEIAGSPGAIKRFLREAEAVAQLRHPNVVHVYTADRAGAGYYLAMEFVPGTDLGQFARAHGPLPVSLACELVRQAAEGLHHAFTHGLVHRDVKPANLLLQVSSPQVASRKVEDIETPDPGLADLRLADLGLGDFTVKVADFGLARAFAADASEMTAPGTVLGTTDYMAPEQAHDARAADTRADVYALGCTLYYLLAGGVPFPGGSAIEKMLRHATAPIPAVTSARRRPARGRSGGAEVHGEKPGRPLPDARRTRHRSAAVHTRRGTGPGRVRHPGGARAGADRDVGTAAGQSEAGGRVGAARPVALLPQRAGGGSLACVGVARRGSVALAVVVAVAGYLASGPKRGDDTTKADPPKTDAPKADAPKADPPKVVPKQPDDKKAEPDPKPNAALDPDLQIAVPVPWAYRGVCWSARKDKISAVAFLADGSIVGGRDGDTDDGSRSGYWEAWPKAGGGTPLRATRPAGTSDWEGPAGASPGAVVTQQFRRFDPKTFAPLPNLSADLNKFGADGPADSIDASTLTADGRFVAGTTATGDKKKRYAVLWEADTGKVRTAWEVKTGHDMNGVAADRTGATVAVGTHEGRVFAFTVSGTDSEWAAPKSAGKADACFAVALAADGKTVYSGHTSDAVHVWKPGREKPAATLNTRWPVVGLALSPDGRWLAACGSGVIVWDVSVDPPKAHPLTDGWVGDLMAATFSADGKRLAIAGRGHNGKADCATGVVWLWELKP